MTFATIVDKVTSVFRSRDTVVGDLVAAEARHAVEAAELQKQIDEAEAEVNRQREPERRLERLLNEKLSISNRAAREVAVLERELREQNHRDLVRFASLHDRLLDAVRVARVPSPDHLVNEVSGVVKTVNVGEIERHLAIGAVLSRQRVELRDTLWRLPSAALTARIAELRAELDQAVAGTALEKAVN